MTPKNINFIARMDRAHQGGNVLFLILIAVALFAALSYVVSQSARSGGNAKSEKAAIMAADVMQYGTQIEMAIERIRLTRGTPDWGLDMYQPRDPTGTNASCATEKCQVFSTLGGGVSWRQPQFEDSTKNPFAQGYYSTSVRNIGTAAPDMVLFLGNIPLDVCQIINFKMGVTPSITTIPPSDSHGGSGLYTGTLTDFPTASKIFGDPPNTLFAGKRSFCYAHGAWGYVYIHVLIPR